MAANDTIGRPQLVRLPRPDRRRARLEDFEMIERTRAALDLLDSKWSVAVIILLASGMRRHARLVDNIPGLSKKVLTATLRKLERHGIVHRNVYPEIPVRVEYTLTSLGWQLTEPLMALYEWAVVHESELTDESENTPADPASPSPTTFSLAPAPAA
ncbi:MAG TPA: helix-turn-helix domain-containing protein [Terrimesophilobacter sp.]|jgi:Predicted transcriptional regulators|uniref:winged helix-turn-helix transcriptional regulator n=1 Tax=Terrimesophilobacter sp. TaxID=2906435 RepID=UPI002F941077